jgi:Tol biopolymer transport system component
VNVSPPQIVYEVAQEGQLFVYQQGSWNSSSGLTVDHPQWLRCDTAGDNCVEIPQADGGWDGNYTASASDVGHTLRVRETVENSFGSSTATSAATETIVAPPPPPPIVFENVDPFSGASSVEAIAADGTGLTQLTDGLAPSYVSGGSRIGFLRSGGDSGFSLYTMRSDGTDVTHVVDLPDCDTGSDQHCWDLSPDGSTLVFSRFLDSSRSQIFTMNVDGSGLTQLTDLACGSTVGGPRWSPDGAEIAFTGCNGGGAVIDVMNANGSGLTALGSGREPAWSADGTKIAFVDAGIAVMNANGSGVTHVTSAGRSPAWSPDGTELVFIAIGDVSDDVFTVNLDGTGQSRLTNNSFTASAREPSW